MSNAPPPLEFRGTSRFEVLSRIGQGGEGLVYEVVDRERNTRLALKTLRTAGAESIVRPDGRAPRARLRRQASPRLLGTSPAFPARPKTPHGAGQTSLALHEHPRPLWHVFARLMQLFPHALPASQIMQH